MNITISKWGATSSHETIYLFRLTNESGAYIELTNLGATWVSAYMYENAGNLSNVLLGYASAAAYINDSFYMGAIVGRFANRIHQASFIIQDKVYPLEKNDGDNTNHGGFSGFNKKRWEWEQVTNGIRFKLHSPDGEGGYPGNVEVEVTYTFSETNELTIQYHGTTDQATYLNLTNHAYFNLSGKAERVDGHQLYIPSEQILETTAAYIPTGRFSNVADSPFDFTTPHAIGENLHDDNEQIRWNRGYNHCYVLKNEVSNQLQTAAILSDPISGRELTVETDLPGVLLYTAGYLPAPDTGVCLETQYFPDTPSHPHFPSCLLMPGEEYRHRTVYKFSRSSLLACPVL